MKYSAFHIHHRHNPIKIRKPEDLSYQLIKSHQSQYLFLCLLEQVDVINLTVLNVTEYCEYANV